MPAKKTRSRKFVKAALPSVESEIVEVPIESSMPEFTPVNNVSGDPWQSNSFPPAEKLPEEKPETHSDVISEIIAEHEEQNKPSEIAGTSLVEEVKTIPYSQEEEKKHSSKFTICFIFFIFGLLLGSASIYAYLTRFSKSKPIASNEQNPSVESNTSPAPTQIVTGAPVDLKKYSIAVLNGSKTSGLAGKLKTSLETEGFDVLSAGNATNSSFVETVIRSKTTVSKPYLEKLKNILDKSFVVAEIPDLLAAEKSDIVVIIGSKTPQTTE